MYVHGFSRGEDPDALDIRTIDPNSADRFVSLVDRMVADDRRRYDDAEDHEPMEAMSIHPRTPGGFWDEIGWSDQFRSFSNLSDDQRRERQHAIDVIAARLRATRRACGLSREELGRRSGISRWTIRGYENGKYTIPEDSLDALDLCLGRNFRPWEVDAAA